MNKRARKLMTRHKTITELTLTLLRKEEGRGLTSSEDSVDATIPMILKLL